MEKLVRVVRYYYVPESEIAKHIESFDKAEEGFDEEEDLDEDIEAENIAMDWFVEEFKQGKITPNSFRIEYVKDIENTQMSTLIFIK